MTKHDALPAQGSMIRERDRTPVDGNTPADYPLLARCTSCHREIRIEAAIGATGWQHTAAARPPRAAEPDPQITVKEPQMEENPPPLAPADPSEPYALRMMLIRRYRYLTLKFSNPLVSESGHYEASWNGGNAVADTEPELLAKVLEALEDCGSDGHLWEMAGEKRDPSDSDNLLLTQRLTCVFCDERERVITIYHPGPTATESSLSDDRPRV
jgi:hypothetical protein